MSGNRFDFAIMPDRKSQVTRTFMEVRSYLASNSNNLPNSLAEYLV